jgi:protease-4
VEGYTSDVEKNRKLAAGSVMKMIKNLPKLMEGQRRRSARWRMQTKLVDGLKNADEIRAMMVKRGAKDEEGKSFRQVAFNDYLSRQHPSCSATRIGVVMASGEISDGTPRPAPSAACRPRT